MYTANNTNFLDFGVDAGDAQLEWCLDGSGSGDAQLERYLDGSSPPIILSTPIQFFGTTQDTLFVSQLCIPSLTGTIDDDWCFMYTLVVMNNNAVTDFL